MRFLKVTAWIWLGLLCAGVGLAAFGLEKLPIMAGLIIGCGVGQLFVVKAITADPGYAAKANVIALLPAVFIVFGTVLLYV